MTPEAQEELAKIAPLQQALEAAGLPLRRYLESRKAEWILKLVAADDEQVRGRIKEINELLELPQTLRLKAEHLTAAPQQEAELP